MARDRANGSLNFCALCSRGYRKPEHFWTQGHKIAEVKVAMQARGYVRLQQTRPLLESVIPTLLVQGLAHILQKGADPLLALAWWGPRWAVVVAIHTDIPIGVRRKALEFLRDNEEEQGAMIMHKVLTRETCRSWLIQRGLFPAGPIKPRKPGRHGRAKEMEESESA